MSASTDPGDVFGGILGGVIVGLLVPVFQKIIRELLAASPPGTSAEPATSLIFVTVKLMPLLPIVETLAGFGVAYAAGRKLGVFGYTLGVLGASVLFSSPDLFVALFISGFIVFSIGFLLHS